MTDMNWGPTVAGWRLSASLDKVKFKPLERIALTVVLENTATVPQPYGVQGKDFDYELQCVDEDDQAVGPTSYARRMKANRDMVKHGGAEMAPKQHLVQEIELTRHLDLSLAGEYRLKVTREIFPNQGRPSLKVTSNECTFEIED